MDVEGGTAGAVIDLAGPDSPPEPKMVRLPRWPGYVAHTRWPGTGAVYLLDEPYGPDEPVDMRCGHCTADAQVALDEAGHRIVFIIAHQRGCRAVDDLLAMTGAQR